MLSKHNVGRLRTFATKAYPISMCELIADGIRAFLQRYLDDGAEPVEVPWMLEGFADAAAIQIGAQTGPEYAR